MISSRAVLKDMGRYSVMRESLSRFLPPKNSKWAHFAVGVLTGACLQQAYTSLKEKVSVGDANFEGLSQLISSIYNHPTPPSVRTPAR